MVFHCFSANHPSAKALTLAHELRTGPKHGLIAGNVYMAHLDEDANHAQPSGTSSNRRQLMQPQTGSANAGGTSVNYNCYGGPSSYVVAWNAVSVFSAPPNDSSYCHWVWVIPDDWNGERITLQTNWLIQNSHGGAMAIEVCATTSAPGQDVMSCEMLSVSVATPGTGYTWAQRFAFPITINPASFKPPMAVGDLFVLRLGRLGAHSSDTHTANNDQLTPVIIYQTTR